MDDPMIGALPRKCLCNAIDDLANNFDADQAATLASGISRLLGAIRSILTQSKTLTRDVGYQIIPSNQRTAKILSARPNDPQQADDLYRRYSENEHEFWLGTATDIPTDFRRRLMCIVVDVRSSLSSALGRELDTGGEDMLQSSWVPPNLADLVQGHKLAELRYAGKKYIKMGRKLGGMGSMLWLPTEIPSSTYERYLNMDDEGAFRHLRSLGTTNPKNGDLVQRLISSQFDHPSTRFTQYNIYNEYADLFPPQDRLLLLLCALGGSRIPVDFLRTLQVPRRRWGADGEMCDIGPLEYGLPQHIIDITGESILESMVCCPSIETDILADNSTVWTVLPGPLSAITAAMCPRAQDTWSAIALRVLCYSCPLCYEGRVNWPRETKQAIWSMLDRATDQTKIAAAQRTQVLDALLYFAERDFYTIRCVAVQRARGLLQRSMPFYYQASVTLFESILLRLEGRFDPSSACIRSFLDGQSPVHNADNISRCDNALRGRLHVSWIENKVHCYERDAGTTMYNWAGMVPLSTFEVEVTRRLQGTAAKYFHSVGKFVQARSSLEQHLALFSTQPIRINTRLLITTKLAEIHCELHELDEASMLVQREMAQLGDDKMRTRPWRRLAMVAVEIRLARNGDEFIDEAMRILEQLSEVEPPELDDLNDQVLRMRRLLLVARVAHVRGRLHEALAAWQHSLQQFSMLTIFATRHPWTPVVPYLSSAHAHLCLGDTTAARSCWDKAVALSFTERCEYVLPSLATDWVPRMIEAIRRAHEWPFRMMCPGGRSDVTWS